ncbi:MAG: ABC transporter permease [Pseudomonadota bacterium]
MIALNELTLAFRLASRQWRAGDLWLIVAAGVLAVAITTLIAAIGDRLERGLVRKAAELLGADLVLAGSRPASADVAALARQYGAVSVNAVDFSTMLALPPAASGPALPPATASGDAPDVLLVSVRAVDSGYPLRGQLQIRDGASVRVAAGPAAGEIWIEPQVAEELAITTGAVVLVGEQPLRVTALVITEPDRAGNFSALSPRVLMHRDDLDAAGVIQPGSRVRHRVMFAGSDSAIAALRAALAVRLAPDEELRDVQGGNQRTASALSRAMQFLALASVLGVLLCGATLALVADRQARRLFDTVALLRTLGLPQRAVRRVLAIEVISIALVTGSIGSLLGYVAQHLLTGLLGDLLPVALPPAGWRAAAAGFACAFIALPAFLLPPLARLTDVSPLRVLRRDLEPPSARIVRHYALGLGLLALLLVILSGDPALALALLAGVAVLIAVGIPLAAAALRALARRRGRLALPVRLAADRLAHVPLRSGAQLVAFALIFTTLALATLLRNDLFASWQKQLPADAPNLFAMNLLPHERDSFLASLTRHGVALPTLYPVTPGRLIRIGDTPLAGRVDPASDTGRSLDRDLILTSAATDAGTVTEGRGFAADAAPNLVSVEEKLARDMDLRIGERLTFLVAGEEITATVTGFRRVEWDSFRPNFFMVLSPGTLRDAPYTWLSSFRSEQPRMLVRQLRAEFPALSVLEVGPLLARLGEFLSGLAAGIEFIAVLLLGAASLLLAASVVATLDERLTEAALLRVLGARGRLLRQTLAAEFALLGAGSGLVAALGAETARWLLYTQVMEIAWTPLPALLALPLAGALLLAVLGTLAARRSLASGAGPVLRGT